MCGISGFIDLSCGTPHAKRLARARAVALELAHRGPDDSGEWADPQNRVAFGFRRLSIIDLTPAGHQPTRSPSGRFVIIFNGEVYNFAEIRQKLAGAGYAPQFRGHSDTEVIPAAIETWGLDAAVRSFIGMFAFALWDAENQTLSLVRDRVGVKPLYYGTNGGHFFFSSELKAMRAHPRFSASIDRNAIAAYMRSNYIPAPLTIYENCSKLVPARILTFSVGDPTPRLHEYWSAADAVAAGVEHPFEGDLTEAAEKLERLLKDSVRLRMIADVPLGVFLSGSIDSSTVAALMQAQNARPVRTFSIGFAEQQWNEAQYAKAVAQHLCTDHTELYLTPAETMRVIPQLPHIYDEPFSDSSQVPTYLASRLAKPAVTVALSGDGGDESVTGHRRYMSLLWRTFGWLPVRARRLLASPVRAVPAGAWDRGAMILPKMWRYENLADKIRKGAEVFSARTRDELYARVNSRWHDSARSSSVVPLRLSTLPSAVSHLVSSSE
jgi:asparagine synthase (glutamine-hydrolysing)